jgi:hypothetical protein
LIALTCPRCQSRNPDGSDACEHCGLAFRRDGPFVTSGNPRRQGWAFASLTLGILGIPTLGLLGIGALLGIIFGIVAAVKATRQPEIYGGKGLAICGIAACALSIALIPFVGILLAVAIPSVLRARVSANEASTLEDIRVLVAAEGAYQSRNGGLFDTPQCLSAPSRCIPSYSSTGPAFLGTEALAPTRHGYLRTFYPGPLWRGTAPGGPPSSPSSMKCFAYVAVPTAWNRTGTRGFCADATGQVCYTLGEAPAVVDGLCGPSCRPLL